jgi:hypothetical protein
MSIIVTKRPYSYCFSGNPVHYELFSALAQGDSTVSFEVKVRFKKVNDVTYRDIVTLPYAPRNGYATIDLKEILDGLLNFDLPEFNVDETTIFESDRQTGNFYLQFREITATNSDASWDDSESEYFRFVIKGGLNDFKYQGNNFWLNYFDPQKPFLTWQQSGRLADYFERMYLAFLNLTDSANLRVKVQVFYTDGATAQVNKNMPAIKGLIYYIPSGASQWDLVNLNPVKTIYYWTVHVYDNTDPAAPVLVSQVFKYEQDNRNDYIAIALHYRNSLGCLDSLRIRGSVDKKLEYVYQELEQTIEPDYFNGKSFSPKKIIINNQEQLIYSGDIGHVKREEQDRLRDAQMIRETWWEKKQKWYPVNIITKNFTLVKGDDQRFHMPIDFTLGYQGGEYYTPESVDLGSGIFTDNVCLAFLSPVAPIVDPSGARAHITVEPHENDPQNASVKYRYRVIKDIDSSIVIDWTEQNYTANLEFDLDKDLIYTMEIEAICTNTIYGAKTTVKIDTTAASGGGLDFDSSIVNWTSIGSQFRVKVAGVQKASGFVGSNNAVEFSLNSFGDVVVTLELDNVVPSNAIISSNGVVKNGTIVPNGTGGCVITFQSLQIIVSSSILVE